MGHWIFFAPLFVFLWQKKNPTTLVPLELGLVPNRDFKKNIHLFKIILIYDDTFKLGCFLGEISPNGELISQIGKN